MISVVIPLFNKQPYIAKTLQSVLDQSFTDFEVVVVNDGSTDDSEDIVRQFTDPRIKLLTIKNSGVSVARNIGIEQCKFPWIAFLDADDWWASSFLAEMVQAIEQFQDESIFATGRSRVFENTIERYELPYLPADGTIGKVNYFQIINGHLPPINSSNSLFRKTLFEERGKFRPGQRKHEDHDLWLRICVGREVVFINKPLSFYLKDTHQSSSQGLYAAGDFSTYLHTLSEVKLQLKGKEKQDFQGYLNHFVPIVYLQNYGNYTQSERKSVFEMATSLVGGKAKVLLQVLHYFPYKGMYPIVKSLRR